MPRLFSNGSASSFVAKPYAEMIAGCTALNVAAPYVTHTAELREAALSGKAVNLIVGLNSATTPDALQKLLGVPNCKLRYFTRRFHAKIYVFDNTAMVGSSNLTDGGLFSNREATICLDNAADVDEVRALFNELWERASVLTDEVFGKFAEQRRKFGNPAENIDKLIETAVSSAEPSNISVTSKKDSGERLFLQGLRREIDEYRPAFTEVMSVLAEGSFRRPELKDVGPSNEANRFLNWVRLTFAPGEDTWRQAPFRPQPERKQLIREFGQEWATTASSKIPEDYVDWLEEVRSTFASKDAIEAASQEQLSTALLSIHAFNEQLRFVKGGKANLPKAFWTANDNDAAKAKRTFAYLIHGSGDFTDRLYDVLYTPERKLAYFAKFCALELFGSIKPEIYPPVNGRMAKALRFLGYRVHGS